MSKDWTNKLTQKSGAAAEFLRPYGDSQGGLDINNNVNDNNKNDEAKGDGDHIDRIREAKKNKKKKDNKLVLTGIYLQDDLAKILDDWGKKGGRGAKSGIVNDALRKHFSEKGLL